MKTWETKNTKGKRREKRGTRSGLKKHVPMKLIELPKDLQINEKQKAFAIEYVRTKSQVQAYMTVYNCSWESANTNAWRLRGNEGVSLYIEYLYALEESEFIELRRQVQERRKKISFSDFSKIGKFNGNRFLVHPDAEIDEDAVSSLKSIKTKEEWIENQYGGGVKIEMELTFHDPLAAMRDMLKERETERKENARHNSSELLELWERFQDKTRDDTLSSLDMAHELCSRGKDVPLSIQLQAKAELALEESTDNSEDEYLEATFDEENQAWEAFKKEYAHQLDVFVPQRQKEIKEIYQELGFDEQQKSTDIVIDNDNIIDPD